MPPRQTHVCPPCHLPHVDPNKLQLDVQVFTDLQRGAAEGQNALREALTLTREFNDRVEAAREAERKAAQDVRSNDVTSVQEGNRLLREQVTAQNADMRDREARIKDLLSQVSEAHTRLAVVQTENAQLRGDRADISLQIARLQAEVTTAQTKATADGVKWSTVAGMVKPLLPLLGAVAASGIPGIGAAVAAGVGAVGQQPPAAQAAQAGAGAGVAGSTAAPEVIQAIAWSEMHIEEWKRALCEIVMSTTPSTAAAFRASLDRTNVLALLDTAQDALPDMVRSLVSEAGAERIRAFQILTAAARPA